MIALPSVFLTKASHSRMINKSKEAHSLCYLDRSITDLVPSCISIVMDTLVGSHFRRRLNNLSSAITNRLWLNAHSNYDCDVLITFPARIDDYVIVWFLEQLLQLAPDIRISIKCHFTTGEHTLVVPQFDRQFRLSSQASTVSISRLHTKGNAR
jgi:hypothetical protein